jgi:hypothetical protein
MNYGDIRQLINKTINTYTNNYCNHAVVRVNGKIHYYSEIAIRALQLAVLDMTDEQYKDFCESVIIYNGATVKSSTGTISILKSGRLIEPFISGLFKADNDLSFALFKRQPILH